jgi:hypothetical protein
MNTSLAALLSVVALVLAVVSVVLAALALRRTGRRARRTSRRTVASLPTDVQGLRGEVQALRMDAFGDMGGHLSWSLALLDDGGNGVVLTSIHGRSEARTYAKNISSWSCDQALSPEEDEAIKFAKTA